MEKTFRKIVLVAIAVSICVVGTGCSKSSGGSSGGEKSRAADPAELSKAEVEKGIEIVSAGDFEKSLEHFDKAISYDGTNAKAWCARGTALRSLGRMDDAVKDYTKAIELKPDYVICIDNLGLAYMYNGDFENAVGSFNKALEVDPNYANAYFNLGTLYYEGLKEKEKAFMYFEKYIQLSKDQERIQEVKKILESAK